MFNEVTASAKKIVPSKELMIRVAAAATTAAAIYIITSKFGPVKPWKAVTSAPKPF